MQRKSGILLHPSTLYGGYSIGSFGRGARDFVDFLYECGFGVWQTLPFCMTDEFNSPYKSPAAFSLNPYFIDLPTLFDKGYINKNELTSAREREVYQCEFERLRKERIPLLMRAAERAVSDKNTRLLCEKFLEKNPRIKSACTFLSLRYGGEEILWQFLHYEFFTEWQSVKKYANEKGVEIIGDIPIYVSLDSIDVREAPESFALDGDGFPLEVAGVPPDYFSSDGQLWGNPIYNYDNMEKTSFSWWRERIRHTLSLFDGARIDHFRGFDAYFSIPRGKSAREGKWKKGPGERLIEVICKEAGDKLLIAEDLGDIDDSVRELIRRFSLPGMRVFEFAFLGDKNSPHLPHNYINNSVAYSSTHDNNTLLAYLFECDSGTRRRIFDYCDYEGDNIDVGMRAVIKTLFSSSAGLVILPIQDIFGFGADTRMNTPGRAEKNWGFRITEEQLFSIDRAYFRELNDLYGRG